jgi:pyruvate dehydrogenase E2 component (dihydrolipoamide acetyltransferase)
MAEFVMPSLGADMTAGTLIGWLKKPGDKVERGDIIAEVDTDKGVIEVEVFTDGVIEKLLVGDGEKVPVGAVLATIDEGEKAAVKIEPEKPPAQVQPTGAAESPAAAPIEKPAEVVRVHASPVARKLAEELGVDLSNVKGTGPNNRIQREDVEAAANALKAKTEPPPSAETQPQAER